MDGLSIYKGCGLQEEYQVARNYVCKIGKEKSILHCKEMSNYCYSKGNIGMADYWRKVQYYLENPIQSLSKNKQL